MLKPVRAAAAHSTAFIPNTEGSPHAHLAEDERAAAAVVAAHLALGVELSQPVHARHDAPQRDLRALHVVCRCLLTLRCMLRGFYSIPSQESDTLGATWWCHDCAVNTWLSGLARRGEGRAGQGMGGGRGRREGRGARWYGVALFMGWHSGVGLLRAQHKRVAAPREQLGRHDTERRRSLCAAAHRWRTGSPRPLSAVAQTVLCATCCVCRDVPCAAGRRSATTRERRRNGPILMVRA